MASDIINKCIDSRNRNEIFNSIEIIVIKNNQGHQNEFKPRLKQNQHSILFSFSYLCTFNYISSTETCYITKLLALNFIRVTAATIKFD